MRSAATSLAGHAASPGSPASVVTKKPARAAAHASTARPRVTPFRLRATTPDRAARPPRTPPAPARPPEPLPTPVDRPALARAEAPLIEPPAVGDFDGATVAQAIVLARSLETIESAYEAWDELRGARERSRRRFAEERRRLDEQGELLVGAVQTVAAEGLPPPPPSAPTPDAVVVATDGAAVDHFLAEARARLDEARARLLEDEAAAEAAFVRAEADVRAAARARIEGRARLAPPRLRLFPRSIGAEQRVLHFERPEPDDAVVLFFLLSERIPSRYGAPFDDAADDVLIGPTTLYADEGLGPDELRPSPARLRELLEARPEVWPLKGGLLQHLPSAEGTRFVRWITRGPVMEAELEDARGFRNLLSREEAELVTGALLKLQLAGRIALELGRG